MGSPPLISPGQPRSMQAGEFIPSQPQNVVSFDFKAVNPPVSFYIQRDDVLYIGFASTFANEQLIVNARILLPQSPVPGQPDTNPGGNPPAPTLGGTIVNLQFTLNYSVPARGQQPFQLQLAEGYLLSLTAVPIQAVQRGQTYVRAYIMRGKENLVNTYDCLFSDYVTEFGAIGWPGGNQYPPEFGRGHLVTAPVANPAAGADWLYTVPTGARQRIISLQAQFAAAATAASRDISLVLTDGTHTFWTADAAAAVTISQTAQITAAQLYAPAGVIATTMNIPLPPGLWLPQGYTIGTSTANIAAGDQWSKIVLYLEDFLLEV